MQDGRLCDAVNKSLSFLVCDMKSLVHIVRVVSVVWLLVHSITVFVLVVIHEPHQSFC